MLKRDEVQLELTIDQKDAINKIAAHRNTVKQLTSEYQTLEKQKTKLEKTKSSWTTEEKDKYRKLTVEMTANIEKQQTFTKALDHQREKAGLMGRTMKDLRSEYRELRFSLDNMIEGTEEFTAKLKRMDEVQDAMQKKQGFRKGFSNIFEQFKAQMPAAFAGGIAGGIAGMLVEGVSNAIIGVKRMLDDAVEYTKKRARDISDIQTVLNTSTLNAIKIYSQLNNINTETSRDELKKLVEVSGDLNVANKDIIGFVETSDKIGIAFKRDFASAGDAATMIAKLNQNYRETKSLGVNEGLLKTGSDIRELNDDGAASTKGITEFISRIGQISNAVKPPIQDVAALGAVFEEASLTAEMSSGGIQKTLLTASQNGAQFGKVFGMAKKEFLGFLTTDPTGFLTKLAEKFKNLDKAAQGDFLKNLKINDAEAYKTLSVLADNLDKFYAKQKLSNEAFAKGTRIDEIFRVFNNDSAAEISKAEKKFNQFVANIKGVFGGLATSVVIGFAKILPDTENELEKITRKFDEQSRVVNALDGDIQKHIQTIREWQMYGHHSGITQDELKEAIKEVGKAIPGAITQFGKYGEALDINTNKAEANIRKQKNLLREFRKTGIETNKETLKQMQNDAESLQKQLNSKTVVEMPSGKAAQLGGVVNTRNLTDAEIKKKQEELFILKEDITDTEKRIHELTYNLGSIDDRRAGRRKGKTFGEVTPTEIDLGGTDNAQAEAEKLAETKIANELRVNNEITRMRLEAIADEKERELGLLEFKVSEQLLAEAEKVKAGELSEATFVKYAEKLYTEWIHEKSQIDRKYFKATEDEAKKNAERLKKLSSDIAIQKIDNDIKAAKNAGNDFEAMQLQQIKNDKEAEREIAKLTVQQIGEDDVSIVELIEEQKRAIRERYRQDNLSLEKEFHKKAAESELKEANDAEKKKRGKKTKTDKEKREGEKKLQEYTRYGEEGLNALADIIHQGKMNKLQEEQEQSDRIFEKRLADLEKQKNAGIITEEQYQAQRSALEGQHAKEQKKIRREQAEADKEAAIFKATIDMLAAIVANLRNGVAASIAAGAIGAINLGKIISTKIPENYKGGYIGSMTQALPFKKPSSTAVLSWLNEKGTEYVIPAEELTNPEVRGFVDNYIEPKRKQRIGRHENGGYVGQNSSASSSTPVPTFGSDQEIIELLKEQNALLRENNKKDPKWGWEDIHYLDKAQKKLNNNQNNGYYQDGI